MNELDLENLRAELSDFAQPGRRGGRTSREERIVAGFEEIQRFVDDRRHEPEHGEGRDILERIYAARLGRLRALEECLTLLRPFDRQGLLARESAHVATATEFDDDALLAELEGAAGAADITALRHVRSSSEKRAAEEIANRTGCEDFEQFKSFFEQVKGELAEGVRQARPFQKKQAEIKKGELFIVGGQIAYVAGVGEEFLTEYDRRDSRLRVIYDNGTESNVLARSLQRALHRDETGRRITDPSAGPLFGGEADKGDSASGTIYVLRSKSDNPIIAKHRDVLHKVGVTGADVAKRVADAKNDPTFLMADVEIVATYELYNINRVKLENLIHRVFASAQLSAEIKDRFGKAVFPREWFLIPLYAVDDAVERIKDGTITKYVYDPKAAGLILRPHPES
jgi:hypothetical protein